MQVDQTKLLDSLAYKNTIDSGKGIENYIAGQSISYGNEVTAGHLGESIIVKAETVNMADATYMRPQADEEKKVAETIVGDENSAESRYQEMAILANTTSEEDLKQMQEDGYSLEDTDSRIIVTVVDKIKAALAKAGVDISGYGDPLSSDKLEKITGNSVLAQKIMMQLKAHDLPATNENLQDIGDAVQKIGQLDALSESSLVYLIKNQLPPTIENVYCAEYSSKESTVATNPISMEDLEQMLPQIEQLVCRAGYRVTDELLQDCQWLIERELPLTEETISYFKALKSFSNQLDGRLMEEKANQMLSLMTDAIGEGKSAMDAVLLAEYSMRGQAAENMSIIEHACEEDLAYVIAQNSEVTIKNLREAEMNRNTESAITQKAKTIVTEQGLSLLTAKRQLEEVRLAMTTSANYALLRRGIQIDTKPLADLVEKLKEQEDYYAKELLAREGIQTEENVSLFKETCHVVEDLRTVPAYILKPKNVDTLRSLHESGMAMKDVLARAGERYEALITTPRKDMGDSITKAFQNVDDILEDMHMDITQANRRAVRILAYNQMELNPENIVAVKAKDEEVQRVFSTLTPKATIEMIRRQVNPLDLDITELNQVVQEIKSEIGEEEVERFNKYLWKLEQNKAITEEERSAYIGIYRLIAQVDKTDGAAIGFLMKQGTDITMRALLTAVRTNKRGKMEYQIDDKFEGVESVARNTRIDAQIEIGYQQNCIRDIMERISPEVAKEINERDWESMTPEQMKEQMEQIAKEQENEIEKENQQYIKEQMMEFSRVLSSSEEVYAYLERTSMPNTINNLLAVQQMLQNRNRMFETMWSAKGATPSSMQRIEQMKETILERFGESIKSPEEMADAQEALADLAEHIMDTMIIEKDDIGMIGIRELRMMSRQFTLMAKQAREEAYMIPIQTGEGVTGISLKIVRGTEKKGMVDILFHGRIMGKVAASFEAKDVGISGIIATDNEQTRQLLADHLGILVDAMNGDEPMDIRVAKVADLSLAKYEETAQTHQKEQTDGGFEDSDKERNPIQTARLYRIAETFIKTMRELL